VTVVAITLRFVVVKLLAFPVPTFIQPVKSSITITWEMVFMFRIGAPEFFRCIILVCSTVLVQNRLEGGGVGSESGWPDNCFDTL